MKAKLKSVMPSETPSKRFMKMAELVGQLEIVDGRLNFFIDNIDGFRTSKIKEIIIKTRNSEYVFEIVED